MKVLRLTIGSLFALLLASGCSSSMRGLQTSPQMGMPKSISPALIPVAPMAKTVALPPSAMSGVTPQSALLGANYTQIPGAATRAAAAPDGSLWVLATAPAGLDKYIWHYVSGSWTNIPGLASRLSVAPNGTLFVINSGGGTYSYSGGTWTALGGGASDITVGGDGSTYVLSNGNPAGTDQAIWHYTTSWSQVPGAGTAIAASWDSNSYVTPAGTVSAGGLYILNSIGNIYHENTDNSFVRLPGNASAIAPTTLGGIYALGFPTNTAGNSLYYYNLSSPGWSAQSGSGVSISTNSAQLYIIGGSGGIYSSPVVAVTSGPVTFMAQSSVTRVSGSIAAGSSTALVALLSGAPDQASAGSPGPVPTDSLTVGSGTQALTFATGSTAQSVGRYVSRPARLTPVEAFPADDRYVHMLLKSFTRTGYAEPVRRILSVLPPSLVVGATASIWVSKSAIGSSTSTQVQVPATLEYQSAHGNIWVDNSLLSGVNASPSFQGALASTMATLGTNFESDYGSVTRHFAFPDYPASAPGLQTLYRICDATGARIGTGGAPAIIPEPADSRINVMLLNSANLGKGVGGYFTGLNYFTQAAINCGNSAASTNPLYSNEAPFFFAGWFEANTARYELQEDLVRSMAHEFQHEVNYVQHSILATTAAAEDPSINEGLSVLSQDLAVPDLFPSVTHDAADALQLGSLWLNNPGNFSVTGFIGIDQGTSVQQYNCTGCYGSAFMFQRYLRDRFGGDTYTQGMETSGLVGFANLVANCRGCAESGSQLLGDFAMAAAASTLAISSTDPRFSFGSLNLTGTYTDQFGGSIALQGVFATPVSANASASIPALLGGVGYASMSGIPGAGVGVSITDPTPGAGFLLGGGIAQR